MVRPRLVTSLYSGVLFTALGVIAWATGQPFVFPSLGPSAFILAFDRRGGRNQAYRIVSSHLIGAAAGLLAYTLFAGGITLTGTPDAFSIDGLRLVSSGVVSIALTSWGMIATGPNHPPACATTLIVSLGLLSTPGQAAVIVIAVAVLVGSHQLFLHAFDRLVGYLE